MADHIYLSIDLKSFFASVECSERGLDPLTTNLVVADTSRTEKTICLAVSPSLKAYGIPGRARLFEVIEKIKFVNADRLRLAPGHHFAGESYFDTELRSDPSLKLTYIAAPPRMAYYMKYSTQIYQIYLRYIAPEDIHVYSIDEVFIDVTAYLRTYDLTPRNLAMKMIREVFQETGITATAGIGTNLYLAKIAMDVVAKHITPDENGIRIAELDEMTYRGLLWDHRPLTDFWRVGRGYSKRLETCGLCTMGDIARCSLGRPTDYYNENLLYKLFGVNAELLIDHAWGWEPCTIADIKAYRPLTNSMGAGQVLQSPYTAPKARLIIEEMTDQLVLSLVDKKLVTDSIAINIGYDVLSLSDPSVRKAYNGDIITDHYGRSIPKPAHGTAQLNQLTSSSCLIGDAAAALFDKIINPDLLVRRLNVTACNIHNESDACENKTGTYEQLDLFTDYTALQKERAEEEAKLARERRMQEAVLSIKKKYGKNAILRGRDFEEGATAIQRNGQIGGHKA